MIFFWPTSLQFWNRSLGIGFRNNLWARYQWLLILYLFSGVGAILANSRCTSPAPRRRTTPKPQEPEVNIPGPDNTEMLIMGILRDKKEEKYHEAHNVSNLYHPIHMYLIFEKSSLKHYPAIKVDELDFYCLCSLQKSSSK